MCVFFCCLRSPRYISSFAVRVRSLSHHSFFRGMWFALDSFQIFRVFLSYSQVGLIILHFTYELFNWMHVAVVAQFAALLLLLLLTYFLLRFFSSFLHAVAFSFPLLCALSLLRATGCFFFAVWSCIFVNVLYRQVDYGTHGYRYDVWRALRVYDYIIIKHTFCSLSLFVYR